MATRGNRRAVEEAQKVAHRYRRAGFQDAQAAPDYCIDELGRDGFYTYTVSVWVGEEQPDTMAPSCKKLTAKLGQSKYPRRPICR